MIVRENVLLAPFTTINVGGPARFFVEAGSIDDVAESLHFARSRQLDLFVLGGGSNLVIADRGWPGLVLKVAVVGIESSDTGGKILFKAGAGESWDKFVSVAVASNCSGVECLSGIPGSVGGTPVQNVGAYGQEVSQTIQSVDALQIDTGQTREFTNHECGFRYRTSVFNTTQRGRFVILSVTYGLTPGGEPSLQYTDLRNHFSGSTAKPTLAGVRDAVRKIRASKGMLITAGDPDCRSAGSFFKNPILSQETFQTLTQRAATKNLQIPSYPALDSQRKVSAAWLVEHSGFRKGFTSGNVGISRKHALAIVNRGDATATEVAALKNQIQEQVEITWGVHLDPEPVFVNF
jgi:UDP-N-acetylmuramate dehydrogenase